MSIIMKQIRGYCSIFVWLNDYFLYNKRNNTWMLGNMKLFLVWNRISNSFALIAREISWSTLKINFRTSMYYSLSIFRWLRLYLVVNAIQTNHCLTSIYCDQLTMQ